MIPESRHYDVLIVGAGPSGLMMAAQLLRHGVQPLIIDGKQGPTNHTKALAVQARSMEIYRQLGVIDDVLKGGKHAHGLNFHQNGKPAISLPLTNVGAGDTPFPYVHLYPQSKNERVLLDYLTLNCCPVYWNTTLVKLEQQKDGVSVELNSNNQLRSMECSWVVGADGAHSTVRKQLRIPFSGETYQHEFYLADVTLSDGLGDDLNMYLTTKGFTAFFPMPEENSYRIIGNLPGGLGPKEDLQLVDVLPSISNITGLNLEIAACRWFTKYHLHHRMAERFEDERCFLIGDAAHIHSPIGGQGMNTGLQDANNLGWKLAGVVKGQFKTEILNSYANERMPVAKQLLKTTDRAFNVIMSDSVVSNVIKKWIMPAFLRFAWKRNNFRAAFFIRLAQLAINYRASNINLHLSQLAAIKAGDRLPYLKVFDEKKQLETDLHEWCSKPGFTLIAIGKLSDLDLFKIARWITQKYGSLINFFYLPPSKRNAQIFETFEVGRDQKKAIIVRPDMHIGYINDVIIDTDVMDNYLQNAVGVRAAIN